MNLFKSLLSAIFLISVPCSAATIEVNFLELDLDADQGQVRWDDVVFERRRPVQLELDRLYYSDDHFFLKKRNVHVDGGVRRDTFYIFMYKADNGYHYEIRVYARTKAAIPFLSEYSASTAMLPALVLWSGKHAQLRQYYVDGASLKPLPFAQPGNPLSDYDKGVLAKALAVASE